LRRWLLLRKWLVLVGGINMAKQGVEGLYPWNIDSCSLCQLDGGSEICFDLHGPPSREILVHCALLLRTCGHGLNSFLGDVGREGAFMGFGKLNELPDDVDNEFAYTGLL
jgi:hypothetical protein